MVVKNEKQKAHSINISYLEALVNPRYILSKRFFRSNA